MTSLQTAHAHPPLARPVSFLTTKREIWLQNGHTRHFVPEPATTPKSANIGGMRPGGLIRFRAAAVVLAIALAAIACGSSEDAPVAATSSDDEATTAPATTAPAPAAPEPATPVPPTTVPPMPVPPTPVPRIDVRCRIDAQAPGPVSDLALQVDVVVDGLEVPWGLAILPDGDLLVTERPGRVRLIEQGQLIAEPILEPRIGVPPPLFGVDLLGPEGGLLGVVLHPDFAQNRLFYLFYNLEPEPDRFTGRIERYLLAPDGRSAELDRIIADELPAGVHHQGGRMRIGPDGMLYVGVGAFEPSEAQDPNTLAGKMLRLDLDGSIPPDNPDPTSPIFLSGIRNTQGFDWLDDHNLVVVDHGPSGLELDMPELRGFDEVNVVQAGDNLGWPLAWGCDDAPGAVEPALTWNNSVPPTGGSFYRDAALPELTGRFLFTTVGRDFGRHLHSVEFAPEPPYAVVSHEVHLFNQFGRLRTVVPDGAGGLYVMTSNCDGRGVCPPQGDVLLRITAG